MKIIAADDTRRIDLPGVGPCPRPVDIDQAQTGFRELKSLRVYDFADGPAIDGESEGDEVLIFSLGGDFEIEITGAHPLKAALRAGEEPRAIYMAPHHAYRLTPRGPATVGYARAAARGSLPCRAVDGGITAGFAEKLWFHFVTMRDDALYATSDGDQLLHIVRGTVATEGTEATERQTLVLQRGKTASLRARGQAQLLVISG